jgi:protein-S-isoprenylcysteine O-methyltransferase Ste14
MSASDPHADAPSPVAWPPRLLAGAIIGGALLDLLIPLSADWPGWARPAGIALIVLAVANDLWCASVMRRHGTTLRPDRAVSALVTEGPYRWSRNPIYVAHIALVAGFGLATLSPWTLLFTPLVAIGLARLAVKREERHLRERFGQEFEAYVARTRRWL